MLVLSRIWINENVRIRNRNYVKNVKTKNARTLGIVILWPKISVIGKIRKRYFVFIKDWKNNGTDTIRRIVIGIVIRTNNRRINNGRVNRIDVVNYTNLSRTIENLIGVLIMDKEPFCDGIDINYIFVDKIIDEKMSKHGGLLTFIDIKLIW